MMQAVYRALDAYQNKKQFKNIIMKGMNTDYSWKTSAKTYQQLFHDIL